MRILNVTQAYFPFNSRGGPAIKVRSISKGLAELGNQVTVLTADLGFTQAEIAAAQAVRVGGDWHSSLDGVEVNYFKTAAHYRNLTINPNVLGFCRRRLREFDLVHIYGLYDTMGPIVGHCCRQRKIPYFLEPLGMTKPIDRGFLLKRIWMTLARNYLRGADRWVATSEIEKEDLKSAGVPHGKVVLRFNGIDLDQFSELPPFGAFRKKAGIAADAPLILFLGRLIPRKGADFLIEALPQLGDKRTRLVIAGPEGETGYLAYLRGKAGDLGVSQRVLFPGLLYAGALKEAYVDATIFALPSRYENFGNTAAEAIACGTPVVVSDRCGIAPLLNNRAGLVTAYDPRALANTLSELLNDPALHNRLREGCRGVAEEISWKGILGAMQESYLSTIHNFATCLKPN